VHRTSEFKLQTEEIPHKRVEISDTGTSDSINMSNFPPLNVKRVLNGFRVTLCTGKLIEEKKAWLLKMLNSKTDDVTFGTTEQRMP
jgi:hypothetical protein